jgi:hypothetical protein
LTPYAGERCVVGGCAAYHGTVDHHLGALATAMGEPSAAAPTPPTPGARKSVTARIRHAIARLADVHPQLAEHLEASVQTGTQCTYAAAEPVTLRL